MSELQASMQAYEDEIDLRELFMAMWKNKYLIISITLAAAIVTGIFSVFVLSPVYHTSLDIVISMPEQYHTRYGDYTLPISTNEQYINLITSNNVLINTINDMGYDTGAVSLESLRKRISISGTDDKTGTKNTFRVTTSADNPSESLLLAESLYANYIEFLDIMTKEKAVDYYINLFNINLKSLEYNLESEKEILKKNEELLTVTPQTINQKVAMEEIQGDTANIRDYVVLENIINQNYVDIEKDIIENKQSINSIESSIRLYNEYLEELAKEKDAISRYKEEGGSTEGIDSTLVSLVEASIYLPSNPVAPTQKTSPSNARNVAIGTVLGLMLAVMVAFVKEFWMKEVNKK